MTTLRDLAVTSLIFLALAGSLLLRHPPGEFVGEIASAAALP